MKILGSIFTWLRIIGIHQGLRIIRYTITRAWRNHKYNREFQRDGKSPGKNPGHLIGVESTLHGARCRFENANLALDFLAGDLVRISWEPGQEPVPYAIAKKDWQKVHTSLTEEEDGWQISSQSMRLHISGDGSLRFTSPSGRTLRREEPPLRVAEQKNTGWISRLRLRPEECLFGLGEQSGPFNLRGTRRRMWNRDPKGYRPGVDPVYMPLPVYMSLHEEGCYLVFFENSFPADFDFGAGADQADACEIRFESGSLRYYFILGDPPTSLRRFTQLTGRPELPPQWSLGYHHSHWGFNSEKEIRKIAAGFDHYDLPLSAIHLDIDHLKDYRTFTVDENRIPDIAALATDLEKMGIKLVPIVNPGVKVDNHSSIYREGLRDKRFLVDGRGKPVKGVVWPGWSVYPDFSDPKTRGWWKTHYQHLIRGHIAGVWHDMNEPTSFCLSPSSDLPVDTVHKLEGIGGDHRQAHNLYALLMNQAGFEAMKENRPERRPWLLSRSGWVSQQRYAWSWSGDVQSNWESLRMTIPTVLGMGLSGIPYCGPDIGGFSGNPGPELFVRWFQMSTFMPFFRTHSSITTAAREPWVFGEPYLSIIRNYLKFRYQLLPYLYSLAWQASQTGAPLVRPLFWPGQDDSNLWQIEDAFMLGDSLLVAPALTPGVSSRALYLPHGKWYGWWDGVEYQGPGNIDIPVALENIPLLVKSGSLLPLAEDGRLCLHVFPPELGEKPAPQIHYQDDGDGYGPSRLDRYEIQRSRKKISITCHSEGDFSPLYNTICVELHAIQARHILVDERLADRSANRLETKPFNQIIIEI